MVARIRLGLRNISDRKLLKKALAVLHGMKDDPRFSSPSVPMTVWEASIKAFQEALDNQMNSGIAGTADKNAKRDAVINQYRLLAYYVQMIATDDDHELITAAGFETKKSNSAKASIPKGVILKIENAGTGVLLLRAKVIENVAIYSACSALVLEDGTQAEWSEPRSFQNSRMRFDGLTPGKVYAFRMRGIGASGPGDWSDPVWHRSL